MARGPSRDVLVDELTRRLAEAEDTIEAIRRGEVDAVVVQGPTGPQVYALKSADHPYRILVEQMNEGALTLSETGLILYANRKFASIAGVPLEEVFARDIFDFVSVRTRERLREVLSSLPGKAEGFIAAPDRDVPVAFAGSAIEVDDSRCIVLVVTDLTDQKRREAAVQSEKLARQASEEANRAKDEFLITVSHELRTPLTSILGWATLLQRDDLDAPMQRMGLESIEQSTRIQVALIEDLLDVSRIVSGKVRLSLQPLAIKPLLEVAFAAVRASAEEKHIRVVLDVDPDLPMVRADASRLQQVYWNLLANALKFTGEGGRIEVRARKDGKHVRVDVNDSGCGISPEFLPRVFERFTQENNTASRLNGGLGLGLSVVHDLMLLHGGSISVSSDGPGRGSTFTTLLPCYDESTRAIEDAPHDESRAPLTGLSVLTVEDDPATRIWLSRTLELFGAKVHSVSCAADAIAAFDTTGADLVISDIALPAEDGVSLVTKLRLRNTGRSTPAIALTAFVRPEDRDRLLSAGFDEFLRKPIDATDLVRAVWQTYRRKQESSGPRQP